MKREYILTILQLKIFKQILEGTKQVDSLLLASAQTVQDKELTNREMATNTLHNSMYIKTKNLTIETNTVDK